METEIYSDYKKDTNSQEKIRELDELIELSEKVSDKINLLTKRRNFTFLFLIFSSGFIGIVTFISCLYYLNRFININLEALFALSCAIFTILTFITMYGLKERRKIDYEIENEKIILNRLFEMIANLKETTDLGIVSKAIYEMRLSRIQFSYKTKR